MYPTTEPDVDGALSVFHNGTSRANITVTGKNNEPVGVKLDATRVSNIYQNNLNEVRVNALFGLSLIRAYQA